MAELAEDPGYRVAPRPSPPRPTYFPQLEGLRGVLASYVVLHHALLQAWPITGSTPVRVPPILGWLLYGHFAVDAFIVLSGFVLAVPVVRDGALQRGAWAFYVGRFWRIVPTYYAAVAFSLLLIATLIGAETGTHWDISIPVTRRGLFAALTLTTDWLVSPQVNHVLWSVAVEAKIYFLFPAIVWAWRRTGLVATVAGAMLLLAAAAPVMQRGLGRVPNLWVNAHPWYLALFLFGVAAAALATDADPRWARWRRLPLGRMALAMAAALAAIVASRGYDAVMRHIVPVDLAVGVAFALGLASLVARPGAVAAALRTRPLLWLGTMAYSLYLIHAPLLQVVHQYLVFPLRLGRGGQFLALIAIGAPAIVAATTLFFRAIERPCLPARRRRAEAEELAPDRPPPLPAAGPAPTGAPR